MCGGRASDHHPPRDVHLLHRPALRMCKVRRAGQVRGALPRTRSTDPRQARPWTPKVLAFDCNLPPSLRGAGPPISASESPRARIPAAPAARRTPTPLPHGRDPSRHPARQGPPSNPRVGPRARQRRGPSCGQHLRRSPMRPRPARSVCASEWPLHLSPRRILRSGSSSRGPRAHPVPVARLLPHGRLSRFAIGSRAPALPPLAHPLPRAC